MVYSDPAGRATQLSREALLGREVWHENNCQSCHQLYGFGGFLGPDLTNLASRVGAGDDALDARLEMVLANGSKRMPAFETTAQERTALGAFFVALDASGVGQAVVPGALKPHELFEAILENRLPGAELSDSERAGLGLLVKHACITCHLPYTSSTFRAPDLTLLHDRLGAEGLRNVLAEGRPARGMPNFGLSTEEVDALGAFLERLTTVGSLVRDDYAARSNNDGSLLRLPWFEYSR